MLVKYQNKPIFNDEFFNAGTHDFYQLVKTNGDLFSYDEIAINFRMNPNNHSFIKYIKLILALPINWLNETCISSTMPNFNEFKEKMLTQIELLSTSNKTAYVFYGKNLKIYLLNNKYNGVKVYKYHQTLSTGKQFTKITIFQLLKQN